MKDLVILLGEFEVHRQLNLFLPEVVQPEGDVDPSSRHLRSDDFLDTVFDRYYRSEERQRELFEVLSLLAVFIASLGLFGLAAHSAEQRTKEIGIRKTLGATTIGIVRLLSWEFVRWVLVANLLAWPIAYVFLKSWLQGFAYRIDLGGQWMWFVGAAVLSLVVAWLTVGFQAVRAARANPVKSLRYE